MANKAQILILVEGAKTDVKLMNHLLDVYHISNSHSITSYNTNIYNLYQEMFDGKDPSTIDLLQLLKEKEVDVEKKKLFDNYYSDIILIFDFDPQDHLYAANKVREMLEYFHESSDMGKLYINYPMIESFYHMKSIPDSEYLNYYISKNEISSFKTKVNKICPDYRKFARDK